MKDTYLFISDFDKTLSFSDTGYLLSEKLGISVETYKNKIAKIREKNIVQLGGELPQLITVDPDYKGKVTKDLLQEVGAEIKLKNNVSELLGFLSKGFNGTNFLVYVVSAAPYDVISEAVGKFLPRENIFGTDFIFNDKNVVADVRRTGAGDAKVSTVDELKNRNKIPREKIIYVGDGVSDIHVMLHVGTYGGYPIAVSQSPYMGHISKRTIVSENALAVLAPILEDIVGYSDEKIRDFFEKIGHPIQEWNRTRMEWLDLED
jgi:HAD superfamily phosphoserine phosphatase-like hydrolase